MPKATAVWLVENTSLSFEQIAAFCGMHALEVQGIADGEVAIGIVGLDPIASGQLTREEIARCEADKSTRLQIAKSDLPEITPRGKGANYTPVSKRQDRPHAIAWILRHHPELTESQIRHLVGTTNSTIQKIRDRTHPETPNLKPRDPVALGLCTQAQLDDAIEKAHRSAQRAKREADRAARRAAKALADAEAQKQTDATREAMDATREAAAELAAATDAMVGAPAPEEGAPAPSEHEPAEPAPEAPGETHAEPHTPSDEKESSSH
jgi:hypothetical protein